MPKYMGKEEFGKVLEIIQVAVNKIFTLSTPDEKELSLVVRRVMLSDEYYAGSPMSLSIRIARTLLQKYNIGMK